MNLTKRQAIIAASISYMVAFPLTAYFLGPWGVAILLGIIILDFSICQKKFHLFY